MADLSADFARLYTPIDRPLIAPEKPLRALLLQGFYSVRSGRQLMEQLDCDLLLRWFVGRGIDDPVWHVTLDGDVAANRAVLSQPRIKALLSDEHLSVDGGSVRPG